MSELIYLKAGAGKTFLVSKMIDDLSIQSLPEDAAHAVVYFYCNRNEVARRDPENILKSFIRQLATPNAYSGCHLAIHKEIVNLKEKLITEGRSLDLSRSSQLLIQLIDSYATVTFIVDAMDECDLRNRQSLLDVMEHLATNTGERTRFFISSRPDDDIRSHFEGRPRTEVEATCTQGDIAAFVDKTLEQNQRLRKESSELITRIRTTLSKRNEGVFQWVAL